MVAMTSLYRRPDIYDAIFSLDPIIEINFYKGIIENFGIRFDKPGVGVIDFENGTGKLLGKLPADKAFLLGVDVSMDIENMVGSLMLL